MFERDTRIAVIGAGAVGGTIAGFIARAGYNLEIVCKYEELASKIKNEGLHLFGVRGDYKIPIPAAAKVSELSGPKDIVLLATKATDMLAAAKELLPFLKENSMIVSMQNGICEDALAEVFGRQRTIGCIVGWSATMHSPGEVEMTSKGKFVIGNIDNKPDQRLLTLKKILSAVVPAEISENIRGNLYSKLIVNSCITSVGAICGFSLGKMLAIRKIRSIFVEVTREALAVGEAMGLKAETHAYAGGLEYFKFLQHSSFFSNFICHLLMRIAGFKHRRLKSSSLQSLERGKPTEIDYLNGYISSNGKRHNIPTPLNDKIIEIIKDIEAGKKRIALSNFDDPFFAKFK